MNVAAVRSRGLRSSAGAPQILVVDDDREICSLLKGYLEENGFRVVSVADGQEVRRALERGRFDLILLDLMLPKESGFEICRAVRATSQIPIIMLTARDAEIDRVVGFEVGADDYVVKPFSPRELVGRIKAVLRRSQNASPTEGPADIRYYRFAGWQVDTTIRTLTNPQGKDFAIGGAEFSLLVTLLVHAPKLVTRVQLLNFLRARDCDPLDRSVDVRISRLRKALREHDRATDIIKTVYGRGYFIGVPVERETI
jgi:two-component system, OmpR family, response regulator